MFNVVVNNQNLSTAIYFIINGIYNDIFIVAHYISFNRKSVNWWSVYDAYVSN